MSRLLIRPEVLNHLKKTRGINTDQAMADIGHVSLSTYQRYRDRKSPVSGEFLAYTCLAFGLNLDDLAEIDSDSARSSQAA